ncbi:hypothetical protein A3I99_01910 [Candidatus Kaiserbacteria bacterium RIFCSPLOWO2_02_FULL_45_11b]|uniref:Uncharacterized protein n=1 Tax=Candidatus Kaiserbacteria bacterium RIFCSPLOWO2_12_FULL_45_26 TaxID=1798525 RepID=A0A1F6FHI4_9BACT|nr:MAG: hypothetical protein A2929_03650 [Candidatus Kaiserbacteria bacterium RIFCSPLOWO2_01_FULL_45_25]OGG81824.1 MAG: hypothetical protein A3I99_01910 [Candidatus Kaiserbacteria bacterium RIFCSPLOWO2_02_FULL_45_11b]OGG85324.1 MAG: hypothetical protein A3G90_04710 [Candidatus Kaiserbacteria bacterium RIFCSPLOWO2_12_FULL_45_26]
MKEVTINGVSYLPASALAKQFRYTTDYIGQLCRAKKVDAQLVGRSWYVNPVSLTAHKSAKYTKTNLPEKTIESKDKIEISRINIEPVLAKNTIKATKAAPQNFARRIEWQPAKYEDDGGDLFPVVKREIKPVRVHVGLADSTPVSIKTTAKATDLVAEPLPEVSLKGKLNISSLEEDFDALIEEVFDQDVPQDVDLKPKAIQNSLTKPAYRPVKQHLHDAMPKRTEPAAVVATEAPQVAIKADDVFYRTIKITYALASASLALILVLVLFSESYVRADALSLESGLEFSTTDFSALVSHFLR